MKTWIRATVVRREETDHHIERRVEKVFRIFDVEHWETVRTDALGNDIYIATDHPIRVVYLNGVKMNEPRSEAKEGGKDDVAGV